MKTLASLVLGTVLIAAVACKKKGNDVPDPKPSVTLPFKFAAPQLVKIERNVFNTTIHYNKDGLPDTIYNTLLDPRDPIKWNGYYVYAYEKDMIKVSEYQIHPKTAIVTKIFIHETTFDPSGHFKEKADYYTRDNGASYNTDARITFTYIDGKLTGYKNSINRSDSGNWSYDSYGNVDYPDRTTRTIPEYYSTYTFLGAYSTMANFMGTSRLGEFLFCTIGSQDFLTFELLSKTTPVKHKFHEEFHRETPPKGLVQLFDSYHTYTYKYDERGRLTEQKLQYLYFSSNNGTSFEFDDDKDDVRKFTYSDK